MLQSVDRHDVAARKQRQRTQQQAIAGTEMRQGAGKDFACRQCASCARTEACACLEAWRGIGSLHGAGLMQRVAIHARLKICSSYDPTALQPDEALTTLWWQPAANWKLPSLSGSAPRPAISPSPAFAIVGPANQVR